MIDCLYENYKKWSAKGSVYIMSDTHFNDSDTKLMSKEWIEPEEQIKIINKMCTKNDALILLGDIGDPEYAKKLKGYKVLISGNHDAVSLYHEIFDEIYTGPLFIAPKILLSHEPVIGLKFCVNIHGHNHAGVMRWTDDTGAKHINLAANVCGYTPISLNKEIKNGLLSSVDDIHRQTVDNAKKNPLHKKKNITKIE